MPEFVDYIAPVSSANYYLIEDVYLKGSLKIVADTTERDALGGSTIESGALVRCADTLQFWRAAGVILTEDEFGDTISVVDWKEFQFPANDSLVVLPQLYKMSRFSKTFDIGALEDRKSIMATIDLQCYSFMMLDFSVSVPVKAEIYSRKDFKDRNPYTFIARYDHLIDDGSSLVQNKNVADFWLKTTSYSIIVNEDTPLTTSYQIKIFKNSKLTKDEKYDSKEVIVSFAYIPLEI